MTVHEAEIVRDRLTAAGVRAFVTGTDMATALSMGGAGTDVGVRIVVVPDDYDRAAELLAEDERVRREAGPWRCSRCEEPNEAAFEVCWSCSKPRQDEPAANFGDDFVDDRPSPPGSFGDTIEVTPDRTVRGPENGNPYRPILIDDSAKPSAPSDVPDDAVLDDRVRRVLFGSIVATLLFPIANAVVIFMLLRLPREAAASNSRKWRIVAASVISVLGLLIGIGLMMAFVG